MFSISILPRSIRGLGNERLGKITIEDFEETFACHDVAGISVDSFPAEWRNNLGKLVQGEPCVALVHDPRFAWIIYCEGETCFVQQHLFIDGMFDSIPPRETVTDDGDQISEWSVAISAITEFLRATDQHG